MIPYTVHDVETVVRLVAEAGDPTITLPVPDRKAMLIQGVAALVEADVWAWYSSVIDPADPSNVMATSLLDGGFSSPQDRASFLQMLVNTDLAREVNAAAVTWLEQDRFVTLRRFDLMPEKDWERMGKPYTDAGFVDTLFSLYPLGATALSGVCVYRRTGHRPFGDRERAIIHLVFSQVDWLHRHGSNLPVGKKALALTPRERQVLAFLLKGDSRKQIAAALQISEHTVGDHLKQLYEHFGVSSRGELQAHFIAGGLE